ncbi:hypothetical protein M758_8G065700, partial [Ceratodon purpureus]
PSVTPSCYRYSSPARVCVSPPSSLCRHGFSPLSADVQMWSLNHPRISLSMSFLAPAMLPRRSPYALLACFCPSVCYAANPPACCRSICPPARHHCVCPPIDGTR